MQCIPEAREGVGSQRNRKENQEPRYACLRLKSYQSCYIAVKRGRSRRLTKENWIVSSGNATDHKAVMTNKKRVVEAEINEKYCEIRRRRWDWLAHLLRREGENDCPTAFWWTSEWGMARGRPTRTTWWRTDERKRNKAELKYSQGGGTEQSVGQRTCRPYICAFWYAQTRW